MGFGNDIYIVGRKEIDRVDRQRREITAATLNGVISDTPVLDGQLRGAWTTTENTPSSAIVNRPDKSGALAQGEMLSALIGTKGKDCVLYFVNNMPYAHRIEFDGYSQKAPQGMVRRNIARVNSIVTRITSGGG
jgi:hypothetical protein